MAKKDVNLYYEDVCKQYKSMVDLLHKFEKEAEENIFPPERLEQIKENIQPMKRNMEVISYIIFLLNRPTKKSKHKNYEKLNKKLLSSIDKANTKQGILAENERVLKDLDNQL